MIKSQNSVQLLILQATNSSRQNTSKLSQAVLTYTIFSSKIGMMQHRSQNFLNMVDRDAVKFKLFGII